MVLNVHINHKAYQGRGEGGQGGMEVGEEGDYNYTYCYTVTTRTTPVAIRWAAMRAILMFINCEGQSHKTVSTNHNLLEEKGEPKRYRTEAPPLTSLTPYR